MPSEGEKASKDGTRREVAEFVSAISEVRLLRNSRKQQVGASSRAKWLHC